QSYCSSSITPKPRSFTVRSNGADPSKTTKDRAPESSKAVPRGEAEPLAGQEPACDYLTVGVLVDSPPCWLICSTRRYDAGPLCRCRAIPTPPATATQKDRRPRLAPTSLRAMSARVLNELEPAF